jgi:hypothetical protein
MNKVVVLPDDKRKELFSETAIKQGKPPAIVEKDFWVSWVLLRLFEHPELSKKILFKGGTSLSKAFHLIERFSEDIDLVLDWRLLTKDDPNQERSKKQQNIFNENLRQSAGEYVQGKIMPWVKEAVGDVCRVESDEEDKRVIHIHYPGVFEDQYLRADIRLEIGPFSEWIPRAEYLISPYAAEAFPAVFSTPQCHVIAIKAERTFWEKAVILHKEAFRTEKQPMPIRYSRHYYDLAMMARSKVKDEALNDLKLLEHVVEFNDRFFPRVWAHYELAKPGTMKLMPPSYFERSLRADYGDMRHMIFGKYPEFDEVLNTLQTLEEEINLLRR